MARSRLSLEEARRIALSAQGLDRPRPEGGVDVRHVRRTLHTLGVLQLDYVNVLVPAHYLVLYSRLGPYDRSLLEKVVYRRREFVEQWAHQASVVPVERWSTVRDLPGDRDRRGRALASFLEEYDGYAERVLRVVGERGPLVAAELPEPESGQGARRDGWGWTPQKTALEAHFLQGSLAVADRRERDFARVYDLAARVVPDRHRRPAGARRRAQRELLCDAARAHGVGTAHDLADFYRMRVGDTRRRLAELVEAGRLERVEVEGWEEPAFLHPEARSPQRVRATALLSPFDPVTWYRPRLERLFGFDYRVEIFIPEKKRRWGYYVLPFLLGDQLVGRVDLAADRSGRRLRVKAAYRESRAAAASVAEALAGELRTLASWLDLDDVSVDRRGDLATELIAAVRARHT